MNDLLNDVFTDEEKAKANTQLKTGWKIECDKQFLDDLVNNLNSKGTTKIQNFENNEVVEFTVINCDEKGDTKKLYLKVDTGSNKGKDHMLFFHGNNQWEKKVMFTMLLWAYTYDQVLAGKDLSLNALTGKRFKAKAVNNVGKNGKSYQNLYNFAEIK